MKTLLQFTTFVSIFVSIFVSLNANASMNIKSIELNDSTIIYGSEISAITIKNSDSSIQSVETFNGNIFNRTEIKLINIYKAKAGGNSSRFNDISAARSGQDSGG